MPIPIDSYTNGQTHAEFVPLPAKGLCPTFGLSRGYYYALEKDGLIKLTRIRMHGKVRGRTLVNVAEVRAALLKIASGGQRKNKKGGK